MFALLAGPASLAGAQRVELVDEVYRVPPREWRYLEFELRQLPVSIECAYRAEDKAAAPRLLIVQRTGARRLRPDHLGAPLAITAPGATGQLTQAIRYAGDYAVVIDNRQGTTEAPVRLQVSLNFGPLVTYLSPQRRLVVILVSFGVFFGIVLWSARRLIGAFR